MAALPFTAIALVEKHITHPSPARYVELAQVSPAFEHVFSSDAVWQKFDIYELGNGIARHYHEVRANSQSFESSLYGQLDDLCESYLAPCHQNTKDPIVWRMWARTFCGRRPMLTSLSREYFKSMDLRKVPLELQQDREFILNLATMGMLDTMSPHFCDDDGIMTEVVRCYGRGLFHGSERLRQDRSMQLLAMKGNLSLRAALKLGITLDKELVLAATAATDFRLRHAGEYRKDREVVLAAVQQHGDALEDADEFKDDREVVLAALRSPRRLCSKVLEHASKGLKDDKSIVLEAVKRCGYELISASKRLQNDKEVAIAAVSQAPMVHWCVSRELCGDRDVLLATVRSTSFPVYEPFPELDTIRDDNEYMRVVGTLPCGYNALMESRELRGDRDIILEFVSKDGSQLRFAKQDLKRDREVVLTAVRLCGWALKYASPELCHDKEIVLAAVAQSYRAAILVPDELKKDKEVRAAIELSRKMAEKQRAFKQRAEAYKHRLKAKRGRWSYGTYI